MRRSDCCSSTYRARECIPLVSRRRFERPSAGFGDRAPGKGRGGLRGSLPKAAFRQSSAWTGLESISAQPHRVTPHHFTNVNISQNRLPLLCKLPTQSGTLKWRIIADCALPRRLSPLPGGDTKGDITGRDASTRLSTGRSPLSYAGADAPRARRRRMGTQTPSSCDLWPPAPPEG
jgi:hypothetical protein